MKLHYYPEKDSLCIELKAGPGTETREVAPGLNVDLDAAGDVVGFDYRWRLAPPRPDDAGDHRPSDQDDEGCLIADSASVARRFADMLLADAPVGAGSRANGVLTAV